MSSSRRTWRRAVFGCFDGAFKRAKRFSPFVIRDVLQRAIQNAWSDHLARAKHYSFSLQWAGATPRVTLATQSGEKWGRSSPLRCFARAQILVAHRATLELRRPFVLCWVSNTVSAGMICVFRAPVTQFVKLRLR